MKLLISILVLSASILGCSEAKFSGELSKKPGRIEHQAPPSQNSPSSSPDHAVTKGIFTVWTEPADPRPLENYFIYIKVSANLNDKSLAGNIIGTDKYTQMFDTGTGETDYNSINSMCKVIDCGPVDFDPTPHIVSTDIHESTVRVEVPGAENLVRDQVNVELKEKMTNAVLNRESLELIF